MNKGDKQGERTHRSITCIRNGKMQTFVDTKLQTSVIGLEGKYEFRTNMVIDRDELTKLNKQFERALNNAHRKFWTSQGSQFKDKILVFNTNTNTVDLKADTKYKVTFQYLLSLRDPRHLFTELPELESHPMMQELVHTFDEAIMHSLDNYGLAEMINKQDE